MGVKPRRPSNLRIMTQTVVLVDEDGNPIGTAPKDTVHTHETPLHLAFSCYVLNSDGHLLITRRALGKATWPGVWTNSVCGHLAPGETPVKALLRWVPQELGVPVGNPSCVLPDFRYRAVDSRGVVENEICPVFVARLESDAIVVDPAEIDSYQWVAPALVVQAIDAAPFLFSPWMVDQLQDSRLRQVLLK